MVREPKMVKVEFIDPALKCYGPFGFYDEEKALVGEAKGKWKIMRTGEGQSYDTRVMEPQRPSIDPISHEDIFGLSEYQTKTKHVKKKRIGWIQDSVRIGGAELTNKECVRKGRDFGFDIQVITPAASPQTLENTLNSFDLLILNNLWSFSPDQMRAILFSIYSAMTPYVKFEHDHRELQRPEFSRPLFQNSRTNVFLSPVHLENHRNRLGCQGVCFPLAIDCSSFLNGGGMVDRELNSALVCNVRNFKSWTKLQKYVSDHPEIRFDVLASDAVVHGPNVRSSPMVGFEKMPELYRSHEYVVHLLDGWGAGERVIFEGALCGCKIIADERAGHISWNKDLTDIEGLASWLNQAVPLFWKEMDKFLE